MRFRVKEIKRVNGTVSFGACCASSSYNATLCPITVFYNNNKSLQVSGLKTLQLISVYIIINLSSIHTHLESHEGAFDAPVISDSLQNRGGLGLYTERNDRVMGDRESVCSSESLFGGRVTSFWEGFRQIFGNSIFGKWPRFSSVAGGRESSPLEGSRFDNSPMLPLCGRLTSCLSGCGITSA